MVYDSEKKLGNYQLLKLLGQGGFADVYLGEHVYLKSLAAIKMLRLHLDDEALNQFLAEARTIAYLKHPHIVSVHDFGMEDAAPFLVMDYAAHGSLRGLHPVGSVLAATTVLSYVKSMAEALDYAHARKIIHRDVKPENMLLGDDERLLLSDFGIALTTQSLPGNPLLKKPQANDIVGTTTYMAPELFVSTSSYLSDQYSLAVVAYEWLCGKPPFNGSDMEVALQHVHIPVPPLRKVSPDVPSTIEDVIMKALSKEPQDRYPTILDFSIELEAACAAAPMSAASKAKLMLPGGAGPETSLRIRALTASTLPKRDPASPADTSLASPVKFSRLPSHTTPQAARASLLSASTRSTQSDAASFSGEGSAGPASLKLPAQFPSATRRLSDYATETQATPDLYPGKLSSHPLRSPTFHSDATQSFAVDTVPPSAGYVWPEGLRFATEMKQVLSARLTQLTPYIGQVQAKIQELMRSLKQRLSATQQPISPLPSRQFMPTTRSLPAARPTGALSQPAPIARPTAALPYPTPAAGPTGVPPQFMRPAGPTFSTQPAPLLSRRVVVSGLAAVGVIGIAGVIVAASQQGSQQQRIAAPTPKPVKTAVAKPTATPTQEPSPTVTPVNTQIINTTRPGVATWGVNQFDLFVRGSDTGLWHRHYDGSWHNWEVVLNGMAYDPSAVAWSPGRLDVFARGADNTLQRCYYDGNWHAWESLGGLLTSDPAVVSWGPNRLDVFVRSIDNGLYHKSFDGTWHDWEALQGVLQSSPTATSWGPNRLDAFVRGSDNALWHRWYDGNWHDWESLGGFFTSDPSAVSVGPNHLDVYVRGVDNTLSHRWYDGNWHDWENLGGALTSSPNVITWGNGRVDIFSRTINNVLQQTWNDGSWRPWVPLS